MDFALSEEQRLLQSTAREFFDKHPGTAVERQLLDQVEQLPDLRPELAEMGFLGLLAPEELGGSGGTVLDLAVVAEQAGRVVAPAPLAGTAGRAALLLRAAGADDLLREVVEGTRAVAVLDGEFTRSGGGVSGAGRPALDAVAAQTFLLRSGNALLRVDRGDGVTVEEREPIDPTRALAVVRLDGAAATEVGPADGWERAEQVAAVILAAEQLGTLSAAVAKAVQYAKERIAFGRPIGSYQSIKHTLVDAYVLEEQLRSLVWLAAWTADDDPQRLPLHAAAAASYAADGTETATETLIQVHGGIGFTWEHDAHLFWRRAKVDRFLLGDAHTHRERVASALLAQAGEIPANA